MSAPIIIFAVEVKVRGWGEVEKEHRSVPAEGGAGSPPLTTVTVGVGPHVLVHVLI